MSTLLPDDLKDWLPWKLSGTSCEWLYTGDKKFTEPFFNTTISICKNLEQNGKPNTVVSDMGMMIQWSKDINALQPSAIIFHVSRCGSTLLSQLLSLDETHIVLSEVPFFDEMLRLPYHKNPVDEKIANDYLRAAIKYYGRKRCGNEKHLFIKTDSWHLQFYKQLRGLFPTVPFILLYRNPQEVIFSQQKQRGMQSVPGMIEPEVFGFSKEKIQETNFDWYMANVLKVYFAKMIEITKTDSLALPVNYKEGMTGIMKKLYSFAGLELTEDTNALFKERSRFHAKHPQQLFTEDYKESKPPAFLDSVMKLYRQLDALIA